MTTFLISPFYININIANEQKSYDVAEAKFTKQFIWLATEFDHSLRFNLFKFILTIKSAAILSIHEYAMQWFVTIKIDRIFEFILCLNILMHSNQYETKSIYIMNKWLSL